MQRDVFRRVQILAGVILFAVSTVAADDFKLEPGFVPMFNGQDFSGWQFDQKWQLPDPAPQNWKVEDGVIRLTGGGQPNLGSQWDYEDFDMRFQWRARRDKYNSGFYIRSNRRVGNNQINLAKGGEGRFFGGKMKGGKQVPELQKPAMEWNDWRVRVVGDTVKFWCNGKLAWEGTEFQSARGHIGLQAEGAPIDFRNLRVQELGVESLSDASKWAKPDATQWKSGSYGTIFTPDGTARVKGRRDFQNYALRLEWNSPKGTACELGLINGTRLTAVRLADSNGQFVEGHPPQTVVNGPGEWNYLQAAVNNGRLNVTQNGKLVVKEHDISKGQLVDGGFLIIRVQEPGMQFRNIRVKAIKP